MNRLVTGLEQEDFQVYENNGEQKIRSFAGRGRAGFDRDYLRSFGFDELKAGSGAGIDSAIHQDSQSGGRVFCDRVQ